MIRMFAIDLRSNHTKDSKNGTWCLDVSLVNIQHFNVGIKGKWSNPGKTNAFPYISVSLPSAKGAFGWVSTTNGQIIYIYIYIYHPIPIYPLINFFACLICETIFILFWLIDWFYGMSTLVGLFSLFFSFQGWLVGWVLWHINLCRLFNIKSVLYK